MSPSEAAPHALGRDRIFPQSHTDISARASTPFMQFRATLAGLVLLGVSSCEAPRPCEVLETWFVIALFALLWRTFHSNDSRVSFSGVKNKTLAVCRNAGWALGPKGLDFTKPSANFSSKETVGRIVSGTELIRQTASPEQRKANALSIQRPSLPDEPNV